VRVTADGDAKRPCQAKVGQLQLAFPVDEQVLRFQVAVQHAVVVAVRHACEQLVQKRLDDGGV
jgi:hypothetical protein